MSSKKKERGLFIFRRDFRLDDNLALLELKKVADIIACVFILDPFQLKGPSTYRSDPAIQFMTDCLDDLDDILDGNLNFVKGKPWRVLKKLLKSGEFKYVAWNADFSPYSKERDSKMRKVCAKFRVNVIENQVDLLLHPLDAVVTGDGKEPYSQFGAYHRNARKLRVPKPKKFDKRGVKFVGLSSPLKQLNGIKYLEKLIAYDNDRVQQGGRNEAKKILSRVLEEFRKYNSKRDQLTYTTTQLSGHLKFGTVSIREVYCVFEKLPKGGSDLVKQLYWRNFFFILGANRKSDYSHISKRFESLDWVSGSELRSRGKALWEDATTGFPLIDACMRQLNATGWMHNRGRLFVANFATKVLHIDPFNPNQKWSSQNAFSRKLLDCCWANNYGNWMWILGPYDTSGYRYGRKNTFGGRVFKSIADGSAVKEHDPELKFIRKWLPELESVTDHDIGHWHLNKVRAKYSEIVDYPEPIIDFEKQVDRWYRMTSK